MGNEIEINGIGKATVFYSWSNNSFTVGWGGEYSRDRQINLTFDNGKWHGEEWVNGTREEVTVELKNSAVDAILTLTDTRVALEKWRTAAIKRLVKSVPRLEKEYTEAKARLDALQKVSFK